MDLTQEQIGVLAKLADKELLSVPARLALEEAQAALAVVETEVQTALIQADVAARNAVQQINISFAEELAAKRRAVDDAQKTFPTVPKE